MKNCLSSQIVATKVPVFIVLKCGACYLNLNLHHPITYPCGTDIFVMNLLLCTYWNGQFDDHIIHEGMGLFPYADHGRAVSDIRSISWILFTFLGITVHCKFGKQPFIDTHSTDSEARDFYIVTKMEEYICNIL